MTLRLHSLVVPLALALGAGCIPFIRVNVLQPAPLHLGAARQLTVVETSGRRGAREELIRELIRQARQEGYFTVTDRSHEGISVKVAGNVVTATGGTGQPQQPNEIGLRIDVLDWDAEREDRPEERDTKGNVVRPAKRVYVGKVAFQVTAFDSQGRAYLSEIEFLVRGDNRAEADFEDEAIQRALYRAVSQFLDAITPRFVQKFIYLDKDDPKQKPIIEVAERGSLDQALTELRSYLEQNPGNAVALYNTAAILDAQGRYQEALDLYAKAIDLSPKSLYIDAQTECSRRLANQRAMQQ